VDIASIGGQADKIKVCATHLTAWLAAHVEACTVYHRVVRPHRSYISIYLSPHAYVSGVAGCMPGCLPTAGLLGCVRAHSPKLTCSMPVLPANPHTCPALCGACCQIHLPSPFSHAAPQGDVCCLRNALVNKLGETEEALRAATAEYEALSR
jgi:hypothetical protein